MENSREAIVNQEERTIEDEEDQKELQMTNLETFRMTLSRYKTKNIGSQNEHDTEK